MSGVLIIVVLIVAFAAVWFGVSTVWGSGSAEPEAAPQHTIDTVRLEGEVLMVSHNGLHHPVNAHVAAKQGRKIIGTSTVNEENTFSMHIPADVRGEIEVSLGLHGGSVSLAEADGNDLHVTVIYNPVNNYFA